MSKNKYFKGRALRVISAGLLIAFGTAVIGLNADAASFSHVHTDACFHEESGTCTNHKMRKENNTVTLHCFNCGKMQTFYQEIYWDECLEGLIPTKDVAYKQTCSVCGAKRSDETPGAPGGHPYTKKVAVCGLTEESVAATVSLAASSGEPTNTFVTISVKVSSADSTFSLGANPYNFGEGWTSNGSYEASKNGTYTVSVQDAHGRVVSQSIEISCIDKTAPVIKAVSKSTENWTEAGVTLTVDASDEGLGLCDAPYSFNDGAFGASNSFLVKANGNVTIKVKDKAGNVVSTTVKISNIGKDPAVVAAEKAAAERAAAEKAAAEKAAAEKAAAEKAAAEKAAAEKAAADQARAAAKKADAAKAAAKKAAATVSANDVTANDVSANDVTSNDVSDNEAKLITIQDLTGGEDISGNSLFNNSDEDPSSFGDSFEDFEAPLEEENQLRFVTASVGNMPIVLGACLAIFGLIFISFFSYIYVSKDGKKKIICLCKIRKGPDAVIVVVPQNKMKTHGRYLISISCWKRKKTEKLPVKVLVEGEENTINTDEGVTFKY